MNNSVVIDERMLDIIDILEQIEDVNRMIELHKNGGDPFMQSQYEYRRSKFLIKLRKALEVFSVHPADLMEMQVAA